jgi:hypothetical protein
MQIHDIQWNRFELVQTCARASLCLFLGHDSIRLAMVEMGEGVSQSSEVAFDVWSIQSQRQIQFRTLLFFFEFAFWPQTLLFRTAHSFLVCDCFEFFG